MAEADRAQAIINPPRNGEGDRAAGVVEGAPSVSPAGCHLPVPGRIDAVAV